MKELVPSGKEDDEEEEEEKAAAEENEDDDKDCVITPETDCEASEASVETPPPGRQRPARQPVRSREPKGANAKRSGGNSVCSHTSCSASLLPLGGRRCLIDSQKHPVSFSSYQLYKEKQSNVQPFVPMLIVPTSMFVTSC